MEHTIISTGKAEPRRPPQQEKVLDDKKNTMEYEVEYPDGEEKASRNYEK